MTLIENEYNFNRNFRKYVDEYCVKNEYTLEEAFNSEHIKKIFWRYTEV